VELEVGEGDLSIQDMVLVIQILVVAVEGNKHRPAEVMVVREL
jgi:hypothetical protein